MAKKEGGSLAYLDLMRVVTVFALVLLSVAQGAAGTAAATYEGLTRWAVPGFLMLCGAFAVERGDSLRGALMDLALPAFVALVVWSAVYGVAGSLLSGAGFSLAGVWAELKSAALGRTESHLWLMYVLLGLYLVTPILGRFARSADRGELIYFLALALVFGGVLPICQRLCPDAVWVAVLERLHIHTVVCYAGCYMAGYYFRTFTISRISEVLIYLLGIGGLVVTFWGGRIFGGDAGLWQSYTAPNVTLTAVAFFVLFRYLLGVSEERSRRQGMHRLGAAALGIYLIHPLFLLILGHFGLSTTSFSAVLSIPVLALAVFLLSIPFALLRGLLPWVRRGEL